MLRVISAVLLLLVAAPAMAQDWSYEDGGVPIAYFDNGAAQFQFACRGGSLAMGFWVRNPDGTVASATSLDIAIMADAAAGAAISASSGSSFAQDIPLIHNEGASMIVRGPVARQWARIAQQARDSIRLAYVRTNAQGGLEAFDANVFGARGSSAAIQRVLDRCG